MHSIRRSLGTIAAIALGVFVLAAPPALAQAPAASTSLAEFIGDWTLGLDTPQGSAAMSLSLKDDNGKAAGLLSSDVMGTYEITDITVDGKSLVLKYAFDYEGQAIPAQITLKPAGEKWVASFDFAGGQFMVDGTAAKK